MKHKEYLFVLVIILVGVGVFFYFNQNVNQKDEVAVMPSSASSSKDEVVSEEATAPEQKSVESVSVDRTQDVPDFVPGPLNTTVVFDTYSNGSGIEFKYPTSMEVSGVTEAGNGYQVLARVTNPTDVVIADSDSPRTQFIIRRLRDYECTGDLVSLNGKMVRDSGWKNDGFYGEIMQNRSVCFETSDWPVFIDAITTPSDSSKSVMNTMFASLKFTSE